MWPDKKLNQLNPSLKLLVTFFIFCLLIGYGVAILQSYEHTGFDIEKVKLEYLGSDDENLMAFAKPYQQILQVTHAHALSIPLVYFLLALIFLNTSLNAILKKTLITLLFLGFFLEMSSLWLLRYVHPDLIYLGVIGNGFSGLSYLSMCFISLFQIYKK
ncbi:hypothetical protein BVY03_01770 [bacterium K02(2017)]|nr:hypothetical protein BVY03_01770 [bacterium K02(2017)]